MKVLAESSKKVVASNVVEQAVPQPTPTKCGHSSLVKILFASLTVGLIWQIQCGLSLHYLTGGSTNVVIEANVDRIYEKLPALTFCTNVGDITHGMKSDDLFKEIKVSDIVDYIEVYSDYGKPRQNFTFLIDSAIETISYKYYCFTINSDRNGISKKLPSYSNNQDNFSAYRLEIKKSQQMWIKLKNFGIYNSWWIFMHNSYDVPSSYEWNAVEVKKGDYVPITYSHESYEQGINCYHYNKYSEHLSRKDCIRKCKLRSSVEKCGAVYNGIDVHKESESVRFVGTDIERKCVINSVEFGDDCMSRCHMPDCRKDYFTPKMITKAPNQHNATLVELIPPSKPTFNYKHQPQNVHKQAFHLMAGNLSLWLGFALYFLYNWFSKCSVPKNVGVVYNTMSQFKYKPTEREGIPK